jgi:pimeloyl-ACP methyl ester carboxylesterase
VSATCLPVAASADAALPPPGTLIDEPCDIDIADDAIAARLRCARLHVLRDAENPAEGRFEIAVVIRRSAKPKPGAAPVLVLHGGPGGMVTKYMGLSANDPAPGHDQVAFDMRGGGRSTPRVCDDAFNRLSASFVQADGPAAARRTREGIVAECLATWRAAGFKGTHFGTERNVADAEALRAALGVERWLLRGESYGTTVAAHYLATRPERIVAAVLDSLYPDDTRILPIAEMQGRLADRLAAECRDDSACAARWPAFGRAQLDAAVAALDAEPLRVGRGAQQRQLDGLALRQLVMVVGAFESGARSVPLLVDAAARRDARVLAGPVSMFSAGGEGANLASTFATDCRDRARHLRSSAMTDPMSLLSGLPGSLCRDWATPGEAPRWPVGGDVPILILAGGYDAFQPDAAAIAEWLGPQSHVVEFAFAAHGVRGAGECPRALTSAFLAAPEKPLDTACIADMQAPAFLDGVLALRGPTELAARVSSGQPPPLSLVLAPVAALVGVTVAGVASVRRRRSKVAPSAGIGPGWTWSAAGAGGLAVIAAATAVLGAIDPMASAALLYGLPSGWSWLPWFLLMPALVGVVALLRGGPTWSNRIAGGAAILVTLAFALAGWSPLS